MVLDGGARLEFKVARISGAGIRVTVRPTGFVGRGSGLGVGSYDLGVQGPTVWGEWVVARRQCLLVTVYKLGVIWLALGFRG